MNSDLGSRYASWGRYPRAVPRKVVPLRWRTEQPEWNPCPGPVLPHGKGRSYGDVCLNGGGTLIDVTPLDRFIAFDEHEGELRCEAGVTLAEILRVIVPRGWFLPVTPGTKYVTVGGAIANDVHGKNHHRAGTFGCHVRELELLRSDGARITCSATTASDLFQATIGGLGLTGVILCAAFRLKRIDGPYVEEERVRFRDLEEFFEVSAESDDRCEYTVAWLDSLATGRRLGRGVFFRGNHASVSGPRGAASPRTARVRVPVSTPEWVLNRLGVQCFNRAYYLLQGWGRGPRRTHYDGFFYPLDGIGDWNRLYGRRGFLQWQCVVPTDADGKVLRTILDRATRSGLGSFLCVLKRFGAVGSPGMLSFPRPGLTLALDFAFRGNATLRLLDDLDAVVREVEGAIYPGKDARMSHETFAAGFPSWERFATFIDPNFSSSFWRRVTRDGPRAAE